MEGLGSWLSGGGVAVFLVTYMVKTFLDKIKEKENRLNKNDVIDSNQDLKIDHNKEICELKHKVTEQRLKVLEDKKCDCK